MNKKWLARASAITLLLISGCTSPSANSSAQQQTFFFLDIGVAFDLPTGYAILQRETFEGPYATTISFGKVSRPGHVRVIDVQLKFWPTGHNGFQPVPAYKPSAYVDVEFERVKKTNELQMLGPDWEPKQVTLLGNKAVRYSVLDFLCCTSLVGYLRRDQLSGRAAETDEYLVRIDAGVDSFDAADADKPMLLFNAVANSLRVSRTLRSSLPASSGATTITLEVLGVAFQIPRGFAAFQWESNEGFYHTSVSFGRAFRGGHFRRAPLEISFEPEFKADDYIDSEFDRIKESTLRGGTAYADLQYVRLFGNRAIRYTAHGAQRSTEIIGYLNADQLPEKLRLRGDDYLATINISQDVPPSESSMAHQALIESVLKSIRSTK